MSLYMLYRNCAIPQSRYVKEISKTDLRRLQREGTEEKGTYYRPDQRKRKGLV